MKYIVIGFLSILVLFVVLIKGYIYWQDYGSYYWYTDVYKGHIILEGDSAFLVTCKGSKYELWLEVPATPQNSQLIDSNFDKVEEFHYIEGRGAMYEEEDSREGVQMVELFKLTKGLNPDCPLTQ